MCVAVRGQPMGVSFLLPPSGFQEVNIRSLQLMSHLSRHMKVKLIVLHFCKVSSWKSFWNVHNLNLTWNSWKGSLWHKVKVTKACEQLFYLFSYCRGFVLKKIYFWLKIYYLLLWVFWLHALYVCTPHACCAIEARGHWTSGTGVLNICKLPCGYWELSPGPLPEQAVYCLLCLESMT